MKTDKLEELFDERSPIMGARQLRSLTWGVDGYPVSTFEKQRTENAVASNVFSDMLVVEKSSTPEKYQKTAITKT